jgi:hypothetical protein
MPINRRDFVLGTSATALGALLPGAAIAVTPEGVEAFEADFQATLAKVRAVFAEQGLTEISALPLVTDEPEFNAGLRHDADVTTLAPGQFVVQPSARVSDIAERTRGDLLPLFHVFACQLPPGTSRDAQVRLMMQTLSDSFGLDPARLAFASVPEAESLRPVLQHLGFDFDEKVKIRDRDEALATRDTSGYFFPVRDSDQYIVSAGIYYRLSDEGAPGFSVYPPPPGWTEVGEITVAGAEPPAMAIGIERITLAATGRYPAWEQRLETLFAQVREAGSVPQSVLDGFR